MVGNVSLNWETQPCPQGDPSLRGRHSLCSRKPPILGSRKITAPQMGWAGPPPILYHTVGQNVCEAVRSRAAGQSCPLLVPSIPFLSPA